MTVFELFYPGTWIEMEDRNLAFELQSYLSAIESRFNDAAVVLSLFEETQEQHLADMENRIYGPSSCQEPESDELGQGQFEPGMDGRTFLLHFMNRQLEAKRRHWEAGERPHAYTSRLPSSTLGRFSFHSGTFAICLANSLGAQVYRMTPETLLGPSMLLSRR